VATRQSGVISRSQLRRAGLSESQIKRRIASGYLTRIHHGVYAVGHGSLTVRSRWIAAILFAGPGAVLSHRSAAALWGLRDKAPPVVEVSRERQGFTSPGVTIHAGAHLGSWHTTSKQSIPVTTPARTLVDLAGFLSGRELDDHLSAAQQHRCFDPRDLRRVMADLPNRRGTGRLTERIGLFERSKGVPRSELETRFLRLCSDGGLPLPEADVRINSRFVDFYWHDQRLIVEVDSRTFHIHRFEEDRSRDLTHLVNGYRTVRVTNRMMEREPGRLVESLHRLLRTTGTQ
jgi:hypothetical protein